MKRLVPAAVGVAALFASSQVSHLSTVAAAVAPGFGTPTPASLQGNGFETDLRLDNSGNTPVAYESAPQSLSSTVSTLSRSLDGGQTWKLVPGQATGASGGKNFTCPAGGGDSELDTKAGHLYFSDLTLVNYSVARSDDNGTTFNAGTNCAGVADTGVDRPWLAHLGDPTAPTAAPNGPGEFLVYDEAPGSSNQAACPSNIGTRNILVVSRSPVFGDSVGTTAGIQYGSALPLSCDEGIMGNDETFDYGAGNGGAKFYDIHDSQALNSISLVRCDIGVETATNATGLTNCADHLVSSFPTARTGANFPTMTVDNQGNLFAVWSQAPDTAGSITGNTLLYFSVSSNQGTTWSTAAQLPTGPLLQTAFVWPGAGDPGRIDVAFLGAPESFAGTAGPDSTPGHYGVYLVQTLDNGASWSAPVLASEHLTHYGTLYTLIGSQTGNRTLGDFMQLRIGSQGEANISFSDSNNQDSATTPEAMFVRQNSGPSVFANQNGTGMVSLPPAPSGNCVTGDPASANDATLDALDTVGNNNPNLDITGVCMSQPDSTHYRVTMNIANLTSVTAGVPSGAPGGTTLIWQTQWHVPSSADTTNGGNLFFVYGESVAGTTSCWAGQAATIAVGGGVQPTYPGITPLTGSACVFNQTAPGSIVITVPTSAVSVTSPDSNLLYSVTGSTQSIVSGNAETPPPFAGLGGQLFNVIDVAPSFDFNPAVQTCQGLGCNVPETPWVPLLLIAPGTAAAVIALRRLQRRRLATIT